VAVLDVFTGAPLSAEQQQLRDLGHFRVVFDKKWDLDDQGRFRPPTRLQRYRSRALTLGFIPTFTSLCLSLSVSYLRCSLSLSVCLS
jgi:hypothetical protein